MELMWILQNKKHFVFFRMGTPTISIKLFRKLNPEMKYARYDTVIQALPSQVECEKIYNK